MARVVFYQKPGCVTNGRQRALLEAAGHEVEARNLLTELWTAEDLRPYFGDAPVADWFNPASPRVKLGALDPSSFTEEEALALMTTDPLLIRRPLIEAYGLRCAGFDSEPVVSLLAGADVSDFQGCAKEKAGIVPAVCPVHVEAPAR
jgi:nitrogenase-associated protein